MILTSENKGLYFCGFEDYGDILNNLKSSCSADTEKKLANKVLQFIFSGISGYKFPICHYPITSTSAAELQQLIDEVVLALAEYKFQVRYTCKVFNCYYETSTLKSYYLNLYHKSNLKVQ